ncbi:hypothetical protein LCGC14_1861200 [marine sediment metagenome]|uniref:Uncharacterized protein n=1 Tax=marine sediment metagenome TaxID=412755 RepID=A0A0F9G7J1_9ZZZZ
MRNTMVALALAAAVAAPGCGQQDSLEGSSIEKAWEQMREDGGVEHTLRIEKRGKGLQLAHRDEHASDSVDLKIVILPLGREAKDASDMGFVGTWGTSIRTVGTRGSPSNFVRARSLVLSPDGKAEHIVEEGGRTFQPRPGARIDPDSHKPQRRPLPQPHLDTVERRTGLWRRTGPTTAKLVLKPADIPPHGQSVNGLLLSLSADKDTWDPSGDITFTIGLQNLNITVPRWLWFAALVVPGRFCQHVGWPALVEICVQATGGKVWRFRAGSDKDALDLHPHRPLTLRSNDGVRHQTSLAELARDERAAALKSWSNAGQLMVWAELAPLADPVPWWWYYPSGRDGPVPKAKPEEFQNGWPPWAWKGKLVTGVLRIEVRAGPPSRQEKPTSRPVAE